MSVAQAVVCLWASVSTCRVYTAATIAGLAVVDRRAVVLGVARRVVVCVAVTCIRLRASVRAS